MDFETQNTSIIENKQTIFYSKLSICWFSFFFTIIFGSFMLAYNLFKVKKGLIGIAIIVVSISLVYFSIYFLNKADISNVGLIFFIVNFAYLYGITEFVFTKYLLPETEYESKSIKIPMLIAIGMIIAIVVLFIYIVSNWGC